MEGAHWLRHWLLTLCWRNCAASDTCCWIFRRWAWEVLWWLCLFVCCLFAHISRKPHVHISPHLVHVDCGCDSTFLWWLFASGFVDDVPFLHNWPYCPLYVFLNGEGIDSITAKNTASISTKFCSTIKNNKVLTMGCVNTFVCQCQS